MWSTRTTAGAVAIAARYFRGEYGDLSVEVKPGCPDAVRLADLLDDAARRLAAVAGETLAANRLLK